MPVIRVTIDSETSGYKYGENGHVYTYKKADRNAREKAKRLAQKQGRAIEFVKNIIEK